MIKLVSKLMLRVNDGEDSASITPNFSSLSGKLTEF